MILANAVTVAVTSYVLFRSQRWWPMVSVSFQLTSLLMMGMPVIDPHIRPFAYTAASIAFDYLNLMVIAVGAVMEGRNAASKVNGRPV